MTEERIPTQVGSGIQADLTAEDSPTAPTPPALTLVPEMAPEPVSEPSLAERVAGAPPEMLALVEVLREDFARAVQDIEFRLAQQYEIQARGEGRPMQVVYAEDIHDDVHRITGFVMSNNSPSTGSISWSSVHIVFMGVDYTIADGNTANRYAWFVKPASGTSATMQTGNSVPNLGPNDALVFVNNSGVAINALSSSLPAAVANGSVTQQSLASDVNAVFSNIQDSLASVQASADGAITSYYQNEPPWPAGSPAPGANNGAASTGDIWYDANDGGAFRWTGPGGSPVNQWARIADTDTSAIAAKVNTKVTTYVGTSAPTAPTGGFTVGDFWINTTNNANVVNRWSGSAWVTLTFGDAAISGVGASKVSGVLAAGNIPVLDLATKTSGTLQATKVGAGVNGAVLTTATGQVGNSQVGDNAVTPSKMNTAYHLLY